MDRDTVIALAREAGFVVDEADFITAPKSGRIGFQLELERFATLAYERGFVDGMSEQAKRSVDKAVNRMAQTTHWEGCEEVHPECKKPEQKSWFTVEELNDFATKLKEKAWKA